MAQSDFFVYRVHRASYRDGSGDDIPIYYDNHEIGALCPLAGQEKMLEALTPYQQAVLDSEYSPEDQQYLIRPHLFKKDYVVIREEWVNAYDSIRNGSSFWGEYCHEDNMPTSHLLGIAEDQEIRIPTTFTLRTERHKESLARYATQSHPLEKFLSLYHCLEIDYDYSVVARIKALDENDPRELGLVIKDLGAKDIERLNRIIEGTPLSIIENHAFTLRQHRATSKSIFYEYGKDSNPIKEYSDFEEYILSSAEISQAEFARIKRETQSIILNLGSSEKYESAIRKSAGYWIYRIRCCIAHNKLGEYRIQTEHDFRFVIEFGIPLLKDILGYLYSQVS